MRKFKLPTSPPNTRNIIINPKVSFTSKKIIINPLHPHVYTIIIIKPIKTVRVDSRIIASNPAIQSNPKILEPIEHIIHGARHLTKSSKRDKGRNLTRVVPDKLKSLPRGRQRGNYCSSVGHASVCVHWTNGISGIPFES